MPEQPISQEDAKMALQVLRDWAQTGFRSLSPEKRQGIRCLVTKYFGSVHEGLPPHDEDLRDAADFLGDPGG